MDPADEHHLQDDLVDDYEEQPDDRWDVGGIDVPDDDNEFREQLELSPQERAMLDQYSGENRGLRNLDSALRDAVQMVQVSDQRITYLRKMHALLLLRKVRGALQSYEEEEEEEEDDRRDENRSVARDMLPEDYPEFSSEEDDDQLSRDSALRSARKHKRLLSRRGPNSDDFIPVKGGSSDYGGHSRGGSLGGKEESIFDPEEALLVKDDDEDAAVYPAKPFYTDSGALAPNSFDSDLEKVDADSGSSGTPPDGSTIEKDGEGDGKLDKKEAKRIENAAYDPSRFARRYKQLRRINWVGSTVFFLWICAFLAYMFIRVTKTLQLGSYLVYGIFVLGVEVLGASTTLIYGTNLIFTPVNPELDRLKKREPAAKTAAKSGGWFRRKGKKGKDEPELPVSTDGPSVKGGADSVAGDLEEGGLPKDPDYEEPPPTGHYHIRVLIPCYKEPEEIVRQTVAAIRTAVLPPGCHRTIYVCDDGKDKLKRRMCQRMGRDVQYVSGRNRPSGEMNGKSGNLNNACQQIYPAGCKIPDNELICVMDADQIADPTFFIKMLPMVDGGDDVGMVLSPQCFHNLNQEGDIFNHSNIHFWEYMQPGYDALGFISCTGTNFLVRSKAFQECGWSPEYTLTEDFALGMELVKRKWQCRYVCEYLAVGEAPDQVRNCFQQRSRWCKGHFQVMFSKQHCPLLQKRLSFFMKILFCSGVWSYIVASIATPTFILVPLLTIWFGIFPIVLSWWAALGLSVYYVATTAVLNYSKTRKHIQPLWFSNVSTVIMFWTYIKALFRSLFARFTGGLKFKTTLKGLGKLQDSAFGDLIVPVIVLITCTVSLGIGIGKVVNNASGAKTTLLVSLAWMIFNMIPPYLLLHYQFIGRGTTLKIVCKLAFYLSFFVGVAALVLIWLLYPKGFDYPGAISDNVTYFQSTMVGTLPTNGYNVPWRSVAYAQDARSPIVAPMTATLGAVHDSSGGWMTGGAGGNIKMTQPIAFSTAMLAWSVLSFPKGLGGSKTATLQQIQIGAEYLKKTLLEYTANNPQFYVIYQVGNLSTESRYWGYPEAFTGTRPSYYVPTSIGTSDLTGSMAAAFAASSLAFQTVDRAYAQGLLNLAANMYAAAKAYPGSYSSRIRGSVCTSQFERSSIGPTGAVLATAGVCKGPYDAFNGSALAWYNSTSYYDDMTWAASWMYQATGQATYLNDAITFYVQHSQGPEQVYDDHLVFNWQNVFWGANLKLAQLKGDPAYHRQMQYFLKFWLCGTGGVPVQFTPLGRAWNANDGALGTTANAAFIATLYAQVARKKYAAKASRYVCFARAQTRYMLGDSSTSFLVGFGKKYSKFAQVMGASCPGFPVQGKAQNCTAAQLVSKKPNPHVAVGALLEQSSFSDEVSVVRASNNSRTAPEYNAGLMGALAGVQEAPGNWNECLQGNGILSRDTTICQATV